MSSEDDRHTRLRRDLVGAAERDEIVAVFQPQFSLEDDAIVSAETLARWLHPDLGPISPAEFVPIAEESRLIRGVGDQMLHLGVAAAGHYAKQGFSIEVAINVSLLQLHDPGYVPRVRHCIESAEVDPDRVILEITESTALADVPFAVETTGKLAALGVTISIDDFGSGFWSEKQVVQLPATELKLDQRLVQGEGQNATTRLATAIDFAKARGMRTVAEGVETAEQLERVRELGCDRAQGFLLDRPMSGEHLEELLRTVARPERGLD